MLTDLFSEKCSAFVEYWTMDKVKKPTSPESNFCDEDGNSIKPNIIQEYSCHMGCMRKGDRMVENY
jgi:hypothetical protein